MVPEWGTTNSSNVHNCWSFWMGNSHHFWGTNSGLTHPAPHVAIATYSRLPRCHYKYAKIQPETSSGCGWAIPAKVMIRDLCEGFQVCLLGEAAPQAPIWGEDPRRVKNGVWNLEPWLGMSWEAETWNWKSHSCRFSATSDKMDYTIIYNHFYIVLFSKAVSEYVGIWRGRGSQLNSVDGRCED